MNSSNAKQTAAGFHIPAQWTEVLGGLTIEPISVPPGDAVQRLLITVVPAPPHEESPDVPVVQPQVEVLEIVANSPGSRILPEHLVRSIAKHLTASLGVDAQRARTIALNLIAATVIGCSTGEERSALLKELLQPREVLVGLAVALGNNVRGGGDVTLGDIAIKPFDSKLVLDIAAAAGASGLRSYLERADGIRSVLWHGPRIVIHPKPVMVAASAALEPLTEHSSLRVGGIADNIYREQAMSIWAQMLTQLKRRESLFAALDLPLIGVRVHELFLSDDRGIVTFGGGPEDGWVIPLYRRAQVSHRVAHGDRARSFKSAIGRHFYGEVNPPSTAFSERLLEAAERASDARVLVQLGFGMHAVLEYVSTLETVWARPEGKKAARGFVVRRMSLWRYRRCPLCRHGGPASSHKTSAALRL